MGSTTIDFKNQLIEIVFTRKEPEHTDTGVIPPVNTIKVIYDERGLDITKQYSKTEIGRLTEIIN